MNTTKIKKMKTINKELKSSKILDFPDDVSAENEEQLSLFGEDNDGEKYGGGERERKRIEKRLFETVLTAANIVRSKRKLSKLNALELMKMIDIGVNKWQLLRGEATERTESLHKSREEMLIELRAVKRAD